MKIEMVVPSLVGAGMETMVARMTRKLAGRGHQVGVTCLLEKGQLAAALEQDGIRVSHVAAPGLLTNLRPGALARHIASLAPDVLHAHSGAWLKAAMAGRQANRPRIILSAHGFVTGEALHETLLHRAAAAIADRIVAVSEPVREHHIAQGMAASKIDVVINGIDTMAFVPKPPTGELRSRLRLGAQTTLIGCVARFEPIKNHALLLDALALARSGGADCTLVLFGDGSLRAALQAQATALGLGASVRFWGFEPDMQRYYTELDLFTLTSTAEGTSISILEAMASGVCCLATAVGGNVGLLEGGAGLLVPSEDRQTLAAALAALSADPARRAELARVARDRVVAHYSEDAMIDEYEAIYAGRAPAARQQAA